MVLALAGDSTITTFMRNSPLETPAYGPSGGKSQGRGWWRAGAGNGGGGGGEAARRDSDRVFRDFKGLQGEKIPSFCFSARAMGAHIFICILFFGRRMGAESRRPQPVRPPTWTRRVAERLGVFPATRD